jgi:hypothetical protein
MALLITIVSGLLLVCFLACKVDLWWTFANAQVSRFYGDNLICKKAYWIRFNQLALLECKNKKENFKSQKIVFNLVSGRLYAQDVWIKIVQSSSSKIKKFPSIPAFLKKVEINNLSLSLQKPLDELLPNKINYLQMRRKPFTLGNAWLLNADAPGRVELNGQIGDRIDLQTTISAYHFKLRNTSLTADGKVEFKTDNLFKQPLQVTLKDFLLSNIQTDSKFFPKILVRSQFTLDKDLKYLTDVKELFIQSNEAQIANSTANPYQFKLSKTRLKNLLPFIVPFQRELKIKSISLNDGFIEALLTIDKLNTLNSKLLLNLENASLDLKTTIGQNLAFNSLDGNLEVLPMKLSRQIGTLGKTKFQSIRQLFDYLGVNVLNFTLQKNDLRKLLPVKLKGIAIKSGQVSGNLKYAATQNLIGKLQIAGVAAETANEKIGFYNGNGQVELLNQNAHFELRATNAHPQKGGTEQAFVNGRVQFLPSLKGNAKISVPNISLVLNKPSAKISSVQAAFNGIKSSVSFNSNGYKINSASGNIGYVSMLPALSGAQEYSMKNGRFSLNSAGILEVDRLSFQTPDGQIVSKISLPLTKQNTSTTFPGTLELKGHMDLADIKDLVAPFASNDPKLKPEDYILSGKIKGELKLAYDTLEKVDLKLTEVGANLKGDQLVSNLNGRLNLNGDYQLVFNNFEGNFNNQNKFKIAGHLGVPGLNTLRRKNYLDSLVQSQLSLNTFVNPKNLLDLAKKFNPQFQSKVAFDEKVYLPVAIILSPDSQHSANFSFSSNFHKMQLYDGKINLSQDISNIENLTGSGHYDLNSKQFTVKDLVYAGNEFGILANAGGKPDKFNFSIESSPLLDLGELAKLWSDDYASGQFRGKLIVKDFQPKDQSTWIRNLEAEMHSEEDVHDFSYGILYGKHFQFNMKTENGNGQIALHTLKGKLKNLQVTNLNSVFQIKDGLEAILKEFSIETADGKAVMSGDVNLANGDTRLQGAMNDVNIETISNNLFSNLGDYNGKGDLSYELKGNFLSLLKSGPPEKAQGAFELRDGVMKQAAQLSKGLNLANLVFGLPVYFSFSTLNHVLQPQQDAAFWSIRGKWFFENDLKRIALKDTIYTGVNALHLSLNGNWDYVDKDLNFDVYGFIPKRPLKLSRSELKIAHDRALPAESVLETAEKSRHFKFKVKGNISNPDSIQNSVKKSINFMWFWPRSEVRERFVGK